MSSGPPDTGLPDPRLLAKMFRAKVQSATAQMAVAAIHPPPRDFGADMLWAMGRFVQRHGWGALGFKNR